jgi:adenylate kinase family enzyme
MPVETLLKLFILGNPGSGKSTIARYIVSDLLRRGCPPQQIRHMNDYAILHKMFEIDLRNYPPDGRRFRRAENNGFNLVDFTVLDDTLRELESQANEIWPAEVSDDKIILIEFARNDYQKALDIFSREFLQDASFLCLDVDVEMCKQRVQERINKPGAIKTSDDFFVSDHIFDTYYKKGVYGCPSVNEILINILGKNYQPEQIAVLAEADLDAAKHKALWFALSRIEARRKLRMSALS